MASRLPRTTELPCRSLAILSVRSQPKAGKGRGRAGQGWGRPPYTIPASPPARGSAQSCCPRSLCSLPSLFNSEGSQNRRGSPEVGEEFSSLSTPPDLDGMLSACCLPGAVPGARNARVDTLLPAHTLFTWGLVPKESLNETSRFPTAAILRRCMKFKQALVEVIRGKGLHS